VNSQTTLRQAWPNIKFWNQKNEKINFEISTKAGANLGPTITWEREEWKKRNVNSQTTLKQPWPSIKFGTRRMKKKSLKFKSKLK
jgi:hypothetical protein